jgi:hypothetical protein
VTAGADSAARQRAWRLVSTIAGLLGAAIAKRLLRAGYHAIRKDPEAPSPFDPGSVGFSWPNAIAWAVAAGVGLGIAKVVSARVAVVGWEVATKTLPPGMGDESADSRDG